MDSVVASAPQSLVESLDFRLSGTAEYIQSRLQSSFQPSGGSQYDPSGGTKIIRFHLADEEGWLDGSSVRLQFDLRNKDATNPIDFSTQVPSALFSRMLVKAGGQVVEDITSYNRVSHMMLQLVNPHAKQDMENEGFASGSIAGGEVRRVSLKLMSGLLGQSKALPLKMLSGLTLELTLADPDEWCHSGTGKSQSYQLENVELAADLMALDPALQQQYMSYVLSQNLLPVKYSTHIVTESAISGPNFSVSLARAVSRLQSVFFSFECAAKQTDTIKKTTQLYNPALGNFSNAYDQFQWQLKVGAKRFPLYPVKGAGAAFHRVAQAVGVSSSSCFSFSMSPAEYRNNNFVAGVDCEKVPQSFSGIDTRGGDLLTIEGKSWGVSGDADHPPPTSITVVLLAEMVLNIRDNGIDVVD